MILGQGGAHYFYYKGDYYGNSTKVAIKKEFIGGPAPNNNRNKIWSEYAFSGQIGNNYFFNPVGCDYFTLICKGYSEEEARQIQKDCKISLVLSHYELETYIDEILTPEKKMTGHLREEVDKAIEYIIEHPKRDWDYPQLRFLWIVYILLMNGSLIFKQFYILWLVLTIGFFYIRGSIKK